VALDTVIELLRTSKQPDGIFRGSLRGLILIAEEIGDESLVIQMLRQIPRFRETIPPDQDPVNFLLDASPRTQRSNWWPQLRNSFAYLMGRRYFLDGNPRAFEQAKRFLNLVKSDAPHNYYAKSLYILAVIDSWTGRIENSTKLFRQIYALPAPSGNIQDPKVKTLTSGLQSIKEESLFGIARNHYAEARIAQERHADDPQKYPQQVYRELFQRALIAYNQVPKKRGIFHGQVLFETAYAYVMTEQYHFALGRLLALESPYYSMGFFPELQILRSLIYFRTCKYTDTIQSVTQFLQEYEPLKKLLDSLHANYGKNRWRAEYYTYYLRELDNLNKNNKTNLPPPVITVLQQNKALRNYEALMNKIELERKEIQGKSAAWRESNIGRQLLARAVQMRSVLQQRAGVSIYQSIREIREKVGEQINQARFIQLETLENQKVELERFAEGGGIEQDEFRYTIVTEQNYVYWPYQGEYWRDEIGYYRHFIQGECKR
jgi:hypothetical protein